MPLLSLGFVMIVVLFVWQWLRQQKRVQSYAEVFCALLQKNPGLRINYIDYTGCFYFNVVGQDEPFVYTRTGWSDTSPPPWLCNSFEGMSSGDVRRALRYLAEEVKDNPEDHPLVYSVTCQGWSLRLNAKEA